MAPRAAASVPEGNGAAEKKTERSEVVGPAPLVADASSPERLLRAAMSADTAQLLTDAAQHPLNSRYGNTQSGRCSLVRATPPSAALVVRCCWLRFAAVRCAAGSGRGRPPPPLPRELGPCSHSPI